MLSVLTESKQHKWQVQILAMEENNLLSFIKWWAIEVNQEQQNINNFLENSKAEDYGIKIYSSSLFKPYSMYGTLKMSLDFEHLDQFYADSIAPDQYHNIFIKVGGTLCYKKEVCYFIVVCVTIYGNDPLPKVK